MRAKTDDKSLLLLYSHRTTTFFVLGSAHDKHTAVLVARNTVPETTVRVTATATAVSEYSLDTKKKHILLDINDPYTLQSIQAAFAHPTRARRFSLTLGPGHGDDPIPLPTHCHFQWAEYERIDWSAVLAGQHGASSYCIRKGLSRKAQLAHYTHRHVCKNPDSLLKEALPRTVVLDTWPVWEDGVATAKGGLADVVISMSGGGSKSSQSGDSVNRRKILDQCLAEAKQVMERAELDFEQTTNDEDGSPPPVWILKGSTTNKGAGIFIVHLYEQVVDCCWSEPDIREWVLQRYIASPLLLGKRKFHIRAYALAVDSLRVYLAQDCLALCAGTRYRQNETANLFAHITNTAYQDLDPNFRQDKCILSWDEHDVAPILVRDGACQNASHAQQRIQQVLRDMEAITAELFRAYQTEFAVFSPIDGCFEHYGLDFMVDEKWHVYLLEVNPGPDFRQTGSRLTSIIEDLMGSTIDVAFNDGDNFDDNPQSHPRATTVGNLNLVYEKGTRGRHGSGKGINMKLS